MVWSPCSSRDSQESSLASQFRSINSSVLSVGPSLWCFDIQILWSNSHVYMTTEETIALTVRTFVGKVMPLLFNMLSRCHSSSSKERASFNFMAAVPWVWWRSYLAIDARDLANPLLTVKSSRCMLIMKRGSTSCPKLKCWKHGISPTATPEM